MRRVAPWLVVLVAALLGLVGLGLVAFWQGPLAAFFVVLGGFSIFWAVFDSEAIRRRSR